MKSLQAYKFEITPNGKQTRAMRQFAGNTHKVWNLAKGYEKFFKKIADHPVFKKKGKSANSIRFPQGFKLDQPNRRIFLPKLGWIKYRNSREVLGISKNIIVSASGGKWFASIPTEREIEKPMHPSTRIEGIDVDITRFATLSDGRYIKPLNTFRKHEKRLVKYQRCMSHIKQHSSEQFSNNVKKAKVQTIHTDINNVRKDFLHKTTTTIRNMSQSAAGYNVKAKSGLNKSILDQGWFEFRRQLEYKQAWRGGDVLAVPARNTSRTCPACGYENNADLVGAINILNRGIKMLEGQDTADASAGCASTARIACEVNGATMPSAAGIPAFFRVGRMSKVNILSAHSPC